MSRDQNCRVIGDEGTAQQSNSETSTDFDVAPAGLASDQVLNLIQDGALLLRILLAAKQPMVVDDLIESYLLRDLRQTPEGFYAALCFLYAIGAVASSSYQVSLIRDACAIRHIA